MQFLENRDQNCRRGTLTLTHQRVASGRTRKYKDEKYMQKTHTRTTVWVRRPRRKFMKQATASCIRQNSSKSSKTSAGHFPKNTVERCTLSWTMKGGCANALTQLETHHFVMNWISDSKLHTKASSRIRKEHASGNWEELTHTSDEWWKAI